MLVAMAGLPGSGKSTIAELIGQQLGKPIVSVDPIESSILRAGIDSDQPTGLAAYLVAETLAEAIVRSRRGGVIIDAVNAVLPAREQWVNLAKRLGEPLKFVEVVCSDPVIHRARLETRSRNLPNLAEPTWHAVEQSLDEYAEWTGPSADAARITLDSVEPLEVIVQRALTFLKG